MQTSTGAGTGTGHYTSSDLDILTFDIKLTRPQLPGQYTYTRLGQSNIWYQTYLRWTLCSKPLSASSLTAAKAPTAAFATSLTPSTRMLLLTRESPSPRPRRSQGQGTNYSRWGLRSSGPMMPCTVSHITIFRVVWFLFHIQLSKWFDEGAVYCVLDTFDSYLLHKTLIFQDLKYMNTLSFDQLHGPKLA